MQLCLCKQRSKDKMKHATTDYEFAKHGCPKAESHDTVGCHSQWHTAWACYQGSCLLHSTEHGVLACLPSQEALVRAAAVSAGCVWQGVAQPIQQAHTLDAKVAWKIYIFELGHGSHRSKLVCQRKASWFTVCGKSLHLCLCMPSATCSSQCTTAQWVGQESTSGGQSSGESKAATRITTK